MSGAGAGAGSRRLAERRRDRFWGPALAAPASAGLLLFLLAPFLAALVLSFTSYRFQSPLPVRWLGLENYERLLVDASLRRALLNNLLFAGVVVPVQTSLAFLLALALNRPLRGMVFFRTVIFLPVIYPMALVSVVWGLIFAPGEAGLANRLLEMAFLGAWDTGTDFLRHESLALPAIMVMSVWQGVGFQTVVLLAGLQAVPEVLLESAASEGAGPWRRFWHVTLPQMRNPLVFVVMVTTILAFRLFDQVWILTQGGPGDATTTLLYEAYVVSRQRGYVGLGSAVTVVLFLLVGLVAWLQHVLLRQEREVA